MNNFEELIKPYVTKQVDECGLVTFELIRKPRVENYNVLRPSKRKASTWIIIITPLGTYPNITQAAKAHKVGRYTMIKWVADENKTEFRKTNEETNTNQPSAK